MKIDAREMSPDVRVAFLQIVGTGARYNAAVDAVVHYEYDFKRGLRLHELDMLAWARAVVSAYDEGGRIGPQTARILARNLIEG